MFYPIEFSCSLSLTIVCYGAYNETTYSETSHVSVYAQYERGGDANASNWSFKNWSSKPLKRVYRPRLFVGSQISEKNTSVDATRRRPNLLKSIVAYTVFWSTFIPQCAKLLLSVDDRIKDFFDLSTFLESTSVKSTIDIFKNGHSKLGAYTALESCDQDLTNTFCQDTSQWTNRINTITETSPGSANKTLINLDDLLTLLYIRFQHTLSEPRENSDQSVIHEQKELMKQLIERVQKTLLEFCPKKNKKFSFRQYIKKILLEKSGISPDKMEQLIPQFIDMLQSDVFSEQFKTCQAIQKFENLFQISTKEAGGSLMSAKKRGGDVGIIFIVACFACCGFLRWVGEQAEGDQLTGDSGQSQRD